MTVHARLEHGKIIVKAPFEENERLRDLPGARARWQRGGVRDTFLGWGFPLTLDYCRLLRLAYGRRLEVSPGLRAWADAELEREKQLIAIKTMPGEAALAQLDRLPVWAPKLHKAISQRIFQANGALFAARGVSVLNADAPGLGKTLQTLAALVQNDRHKILILCRKTAVTTVWTREIRRWLGPGPVNAVAATGTRAARQRAIAGYHALPGFGMQFLICNIEMARVIRRCPNGETQRQCRKKCIHESKFRWKEEPDYPELFAEPFDAIVCDESHRAIIGPSERSESVTQVRSGLKKLPATSDAMLLPLSGTPFRGKNENSWGTLNWIDKSRFSSYWDFMKMYFTVEEDEHEHLIIAQMRPTRIRTFDRALDPYVIRRTKPEVAPDMPLITYGGSLLNPRDENSPAGVWLEMSDAQAKAYKSMKELGDAQIEGGLLTAAGTLAEMTRLRQFAASACRMEEDPSSDTGFRVYPALPSNKADWLVGFMEDTGGASKVVVASQFTSLLELLDPVLTREGYQPALLTGNTSPRARDRAQDDFQEGDLNLILVNTVAGGESINLGVAEYLIFLDETWIPDEQEQMENRGHRLSHPTGLMVYYLRSLGTIEEQIAWITGAREGAVKARLDGSRGVEARKLIASM